MYGTAVNNNDQVVGYGRVGGVGSTTLYQAFIWDDSGGTRALPTFGGTQSIAHGINDSGQIVGSASIAGSTANHAVLWSGGTVTDLNCPGRIYSQAYGINESGEIVGYQTQADSAYHAFLYSGGEIIILNDQIDPNTGWNLRFAKDINENGWITGEGLDPNGKMHGFVLVPIITTDDSDGDGTPNSSDGCPYDTNRTTAGVCGCGVADTDTDGDGTLNCNDLDDDNDGMPDDWEGTYGLNPLVDDAAGDKDGDGISNLQEFLNGTNPSVVNNPQPSFQVPVGNGLWMIPSIITGLFFLRRRFRA